MPKTPQPTPAIDRPPARPDAVLQRRGVERVQAILAAAEAILATEGYEAATLKAIGERADIPTASVYHYFSDRNQVEVELMRGHLEGLDAQVTATMQAAEPLTSLRAVVGAILDANLEYFRAHPSLVELWFSGRSEDLATMAQAFDAASAAFAHRLTTERGLLRKDTPLLVIELAFVAANSLFDLAFRRRPRVGDDEIIEQIRALITAYLETYAPR